MFGYQVDVIIKRFKPSGSVFVEPEEVRVYEDTKFLDGDDSGRLNDILDSSKSEAFEAIQKDIDHNCEHQNLVDFEEDHICTTCMRTRDDIEAEIAEDDHERRVDAEIDNAKL